MSRQTLTYHYFLGLKTLTVIRDAVENIKKSQGVEIDIEHIDLEDPAIYEMISRGDCGGVFQLESSGIIQFMKEFKPNTFEDIIAGISLYRPGPMDQIPRFIENRNHPENITYLHESLKPILGVTYGCIVYQEQVMQIFRDLAGFSMGRSDLVRRAMSKKKQDVMEHEGEVFLYGEKDEAGNQIIDGCLNRGIEIGVAQKIWEEMRDFAKYAFNKSHAAAYAVLGCQTAWLKVHYPAEFYAALLSSVMHNNTRTSRYLEECRQRGIEVVAPDVNTSFYKYTVENGKIVFGLGGIKNVGSNFIDSIVKEREAHGDFTSLIDFCQRVEGLNKRALQSLIKAGAFDFTGIDRANLLAAATEALKQGQALKRIKLSGQTSFFGETLPQTSQNETQAVEPFSPEMELRLEKEVLGVYLSSHPLQRYKEYVEKALPNTMEITQSYEDLTKNIVDQSITRFAGMITDVRTQLTKNKELMAFAKLEDQYGSMDLTVFPRTFESEKAFLVEDLPVVATGKICYDEELNVSLVLEKLEPLTDKSEALKKYLRQPEKYPRTLLKKGVLTLVFDRLEQQKHVGTLKNILKTSPGKIPVILYFKNEGKRFKASENLSVEVTDKLLENLNMFLGQLD